MAELEVETDTGTDPERFVQVSVAGQACALRANGQLACWGYDPEHGGDGGTDAPEGAFAYVTVGLGANCAIDPEAAVQCWGLVENVDPDELPPGRIVGLAVLEDGVCGLYPSGEVACTGWFGLHYPPPEHLRFRRIRGSSSDVVCGVTTDGTLSCWGENHWGEIYPPSGEFTDVDCHTSQCCALDDDGIATCWGISEDEADYQPPDAALVAVAASAYICAGLTAAGELLTWGSEEDDTPGPGGTYRHVASGSGACAVDDHGDLLCWGSNPWILDPPD